MRLPKGISIKPQFLTRDRLCQTGKLKGILQRNASPGVSYGQALANLPATQKRIAGRLAPEGRAIVDACRKAFFGSGKFVVDARPNYPDPVPGLLYLFLSRPSAKGALAGVGVLSLYDRSSPLATTDPKVIELTPALTVNIFNDPTPDGRYGYRLKLLPERVGSLALSLAELRVETPGITATTPKGTCTTRRGGTCVKRTVEADQGFLGDRADMPDFRQAALQGRLQLRHGFAHHGRHPGSLPALQALTLARPRHPSDEGLPRLRRGGAGGRAQVPLLRLPLRRRGGGSLRMVACSGSCAARRRRTTSRSCCTNGASCCATARRRASSSSARVAGSVGFVVVTETRFRFVGDARSTTGPRPVLHEHALSELVRVDDVRRHARRALAIEWADGSITVALARRDLARLQELLEPHTR